MKKLYTLLTFLTLFSVCATAQTLKGHIYDAKPTNHWWEQPLPTNSTATRE